MNKPPPFTDRRERAFAAGCATALGLVVALAPPLDLDPGPVPVAPVCRLCANTAVLSLSLIQWYQDPAGHDLGEDADLGIGVCAPCAETHAPGLLPAQREKTFSRTDSRRSARARFLLAHYRIRGAVAPLLLALGYDQATAVAAAAMPDADDL